MAGLDDNGNKLPDQIKDVTYWIKTIEHLPNRKDCGDYECVIALRNTMSINEAVREVLVPPSIVNVVTHSHWCTIPDYPGIKIVDDKSDIDWLLEERYHVNRPSPPLSQENLNLLIIKVRRLESQLLKQKARK